ncbi:MAG: MaoC family dehydratase [Acidimicrobiales bacterium]|nr:MaoC family dehydratase [Acidimicrobiales bacterium]
MERERIKDFVEATHDPNRIHVDEDFARAAGFPSVIASGGMTLAWAGQYLTRLVGVRNVRRLSVQLRAPVFPGDVLRFGGTIAERRGDELDCEFTATNQDGRVAAKCQSTILVG